MRRLLERRRTAMAPKLRTKAGMLTGRRGDLKPCHQVRTRRPLSTGRSRPSIQSNRQIELIGSDQIDRSKWRFSIKPVNNGRTGSVGPISCGSKQLFCTFNLIVENEQLFDINQILEASCFDQHKIAILLLISFAAKKR